MENFKIVPQHKINKTLILFAGDSKDLQKLKDKFPDIKSSDIYPVVQTEFDYQFFFYTVDDNDINNIKYTAEQLFKDLVPLAPTKPKSKTLIPGIISLIILLGLGIGYKLYQKKQFQKISTHNIEQTIQNDILTDTVKQNVKTDMQSKSTKSEDEFKISYVDKKPDGITSNYTDVSKTYGKLKVVFVDVGQGDAAIIVTPAKKCYIIDTGENNSDGKKIVNILSKLGVTKIDVMVLTHPHADHIGGAYYIMKNFKVQEIWDSGKPYTTRTYKRILSEIKRQNIGYKIPQRGDKFNWASGIKIKVLNPVKNSNNSTNNYSIVIQLKYGNTSFMFTGDMEKEVEHELIKQFGSSLKSDILKVGHHCSHTSSTKTFLDAVNPDYCVICVGSGNRYGHPHNSTFDRLHNYTDKIYRTDNHGNIYMQTDGNNIEIKYDKNIDFISFNLFILNKEVEKIG